MIIIPCTAFSKAGLRVREMGKMEHNHREMVYANFPLAKQSIYLIPSPHKEPIQHYCSFAYE